MEACVDELKSFHQSHLHKNQRGEDERQTKYELKNIIHLVELPEDHFIHYILTRALRIDDISAYSQHKFLTFESNESVIKRTSELLFCRCFTDTDINFD